MTPEDACEQYTITLDVLKHWVEQRTVCPECFEPIGECEHIDDLPENYGGTE